MTDPRQALAERWAQALGLERVGWHVAALRLDRAGVALAVDGNPGPLLLFLAPAAAAAPRFAEVGGVALSHGAPANAAFAADAFAALRRCAQHLEAQARLQLDTAALYAATLQQLLTLRAEPLRALLDAWPTSDAPTARPIRHWLDNALDAGLPPELVEPSLDLQGFDFRLICQAVPPESGPRIRAEAACAFLASLRVRVEPQALEAFLVEAGRTLLVGVAASRQGPARAKVYLLAEAPTPALAQAVGDLFGAAAADAVDPAAHLIGVDLEAAPGTRVGEPAGSPEAPANPLAVKCYVRLGEAAGRVLADEPLGELLRRRGLDAAALEVHRCVRRDLAGKIVDVSLHAHLPAAAGMAPGIAWAEASGAEAAAGWLRAAGALGWRCGVLSQTLGGGGHVYLALASPAADALRAGTASAS